MRAWAYLLMSGTAWEVSGTFLATQEEEDGWGQEHVDGDGTLLAPRPMTKRSSEGISTFSSPWGSPPTRSPCPWCQVTVPFLPSLPPCAAAAGP